MKFVLVMFSLAVSLLGSPSFAQSLETEDVTRFITAVEALEERGVVELDALQDRFEASLEVAAPLDSEGRIALYQHTYNNLALPSEKRVLDSIFAAAGFQAHENWQMQSDLIVAAYFKLKADEGVFDLLAALSATQSDLLTPEMVKQIEVLIVMAQAAEFASPDDVVLVQPYLEQLEAAMEDVFPQPQ